MRKIRKNNVKRWLAAAVFTVCSCMQFAVVHAEGNKKGDGDTITNTSSLGTVSISLDEYSIKNGKEIPFSNNQLVSPGTKVDLHARITNNANSVWLRARADYSTEDIISEIDDTSLIFDRSKWIKCGNYYYYHKPVGTKESAIYLTGIQIPKEWTEQEAGKTFNLIVKCEAIQSANFTPDYSLNDPWHGEVIEASINDHFIAKESGADQFVITYIGGTDELFHNPENFFTNISTLMPGDHYSEGIKCSNDFNYPITLLFSGKSLEGTELASRITLRIDADGEGTIFSGTLADVINERKLFRLEPGESKQMYFFLDVDPTIKNRYTDENMRYLKVNWVFRTYIHMPEQDKSGSGWKTGVLTGDPEQLRMYLYMLLGAGGVIILCAVMLINSREKAEQK